MSEIAFDPEHDVGTDVVSPPSAFQTGVTKRPILPPRPPTDDDETPPPSGYGLESLWRHLRTDEDETLTDFAAEGWQFPGSSRDAPGDRSEGAPPSTSRPLSTWRPRQEYPSYAPPSVRPEAGRAFAIKVLDRSSELIQSYRVRYDVFESLGYLQQENRSRLEIDEYDAYSIPFGAIATDTRELVGTLRLITPHVQPFYLQRIRRILDYCDDPALRQQVERSRPRAMPSLDSALVAAMMGFYNTDDQPVQELSRTITHPASRGVGISRGLMEFGLAYAMTTSDPILIGACIPEHVAMYAKYGYELLPGTDLERNDTVGQIANTVVCNTRRLPQPTVAKVMAILRAMRSGEAEFLLEVTASKDGSQSKFTYHFAEHATRRGTRAARIGGAQHAVR